MVRNTRCTRTSMPTEREREHSGPTDEVGSEGGSPGDLELNRNYKTTKGHEKTSTVSTKETDVTERDRDLTRDDRPQP